MSGLARAVYVSNGRGGTVTPIATTTNTPGPPIPVGRGPGLIVTTPDGKTAYITSDESIVVPIDTATGTPGPPITVGVNRSGLHDQPDGIAITPDGKTVYVATQQWSGIEGHGDADQHRHQQGRPGHPGWQFPITP